MAEYAWRNWALPRYASAIGENRNEFFLVDGNGNGLAQLARALRIAADDRIDHVEAHVHHRSRHGRLQADVLLAHLVRQRDVAAGCDLDGLVEAVGGDAGGIVVTLQKLVPVRNTFLFQAEYRLVDERHHFPRIVEQAGRLVAVFSFGRIRLAGKIGITFHYHDAIRIIDGKHVGARANRIPVERKIFSLRHPRLRIKTLCFPWNRREERHREPVDELRVFALELDAIGICVDDLHAIEGKFLQVEVAVGGRRLGCILQLGRVVFHADDVFADQPENRGMQFRMGEAADLESVVVGYQFAGAGEFEIAQLVDILQVLTLELVIPVLPILVLGKGGMRLIHDAGLDMYFVDAVGNLGARRGIRHLSICGIVVSRLGHCRSSQRGELVRPLEIVVLQRRHVDLRREHRFVFGIGLHRIEMLGPLGKRRVENILTGLLHRIGIVPGSAARAERCWQHQGQDYCEAFHCSEV